MSNISVDLSQGWPCDAAPVHQSAAGPWSLLSLYSPADAFQSALLLLPVSKAVWMSFSSSILQGSISNALLKSGRITSSVRLFIH